MKPLGIKKILILIAVICIAVGGFFWYLSIKDHEEITKSKEVGEEEAAPLEEEKVIPPKEEEEIPLPKYTWDGEYSFRVSSEKGVYPKFKSGTFSKRPFDIIGGVDKELEASIVIEDPDGISEVELEIIGHEGDVGENIKLELSEGDSKLGTWSGKFEIPKEMKRIFWTNFYAWSNKGKIEDLSLDWRPGNTCPISPTGNLTFGNCFVYSDETAGTENGQITVTGAVNLSGTYNHPAYMIFGTKVIFNGGKIIFSAHVSGKATAILIKKGKTDSVHSKTATLCAYPSNCYVCGSGLACISGNCQSDSTHIVNGNSNKNCNTVCSESGGRTCGHVGINATKDDMKYYKEPCCNNPTGSCATSPGSQDCLTRAADCSTVMRKGVETWGSEFCCYGNKGQQTICYCYCP